MQRYGTEPSYDRGVTSEPLSGEWLPKHAGRRSCVVFCLLFQTRTWSHLRALWTIAFNPNERVSCDQQGLSEDETTVWHCIFPLSVLCFKRYLVLDASVWCEEATVNGVVNCILWGDKGNCHDEATQSFPRAPPTEYRT